MDLGDAAVLGIAEVADQGDDVEAELMMGQGIVGFRLGTVGLVEAWAGGVGAAPDEEDQADGALQGGDGAAGFVSIPEGVAARRAAPGQGGQPGGVLRPWPGSGTHGETSTSVPHIILRTRKASSAKIAVLEKKVAPFA